MKKLVILQSFRDKDDFSVKYDEGKMYEFTDKRAKELIDKGLAKVVDKQK